ncbi:MAG: sodium:glutamate symporter [Chloroflexi bacterium]|nr:sodium:glutamate symporter [Chloroflexota bacterium]
MLGISVLVRRYVGVLGALFIPASVIAGFLILFLGPQILGALTGTAGLIPAPILTVWSSLPSLLINVVFAAVMLGKRLPPLRAMWNDSAAHFILGSVFSFGQFALGGLAVALVLTPLFGLNSLAGSILELSFAGGHGTIAGMGPLLAEGGAPELIDLGLGLATISMVTGVVCGSFLVRWAVSNPRIPVARTSPPQRQEQYDVDELQVAPADGPSEAVDHGLGSVTAAFMFMACAIAIAIVLLELVRWVTGLVGVHVFDDFPLFPLTVIGGFIVQMFMTAQGGEQLIDRAAVSGISAIALDALIACAIGTMSLATLGANVPALVILTVLAVAWSVVGALWLGPRVHTRNWFEHTIADFGQSQGNVATGFVLADMSDPARSTRAVDAYGYKQLTYEPLLGGGLLTALSIPLLEQIGPLAFGVLSLVVTVALIAWGILRSRSFQRSTS